MPSPRATLLTVDACGGRGAAFHLSTVERDTPSSYRSRRTQLQPRSVRISVMRAQSGHAGAVFGASMLLVVASWWELWRVSICRDLCRTVASCSVDTSTPHNSLRGCDALPTD